jgi:hemerythrin-like domain-containing protein
LLVPIDGTDSSIDAVSQAVNLARELGARVTFCHTPRDQPASLAAERLAKAESAARAHGVPCASISASPLHRAALASAQEAGCDLIVMPGPAQNQGLFAETTIPVLVCASAEPSAAARTIAAIRDDHRALAAVVHALLHLFSINADGRTVPDAALLLAGVRYLQGFSLGVHHPKEELHLFSKLRQRTSLYDSELAELERQHAREARLIDELIGMAELGVESAKRSEEFQPAVERFASFLWEHYGREEGVILPAAQRYLRPEDWADIENALFGAGG